MSDNPTSEPEIGEWVSGHRWDAMGSVVIGELLAAEPGETGRRVRDRRGQVHGIRPGSARSLDPFRNREVQR